MSLLHPASSEPYHLLVFEFNHFASHPSCYIPFTHFKPGVDESKQALLVKSLSGSNGTERVFYAHTAQDQAYPASYGQAKFGRPARTYLQDLCADKGWKTWRTCRERWMIDTKGDRGSRKSVLAARHDDDNFLKLNQFSG